MALDCASLGGTGYRKEFQRRNRGGDEKAAALVLHFDYMQDVPFTTTLISAASGAADGLYLCALCYMNLSRYHQQNGSSSEDPIPLPMTCTVQDKRIPDGHGFFCALPLIFMRPSALADLALFVTTERLKRAKAQGVSPHEIPVVVFGCSYPGALAAFSRMKYPFLISGAISSSSPIKAIEEFRAFDSVVKNSLPNSCRDAAAAAFAALNNKINEGHIDEELRRFGCQGVASSSTQEKVAFLYSIVDAVAEAVQYNRPVERPLIDSFCTLLGALAGPTHEGAADTLTETIAGKFSGFNAHEKFHLNEKFHRSDARKGELQGEAAQEVAGNPVEREAGEVREEALSGSHGRGQAVQSSEAHTEKSRREERLLQGLAQYFAESLKRKKAKCKDVNMLAATETKLDNSILSNTRLWMWQSCAQFGFWQVGYPGSLRPQSINVQFHLDVCNKLFPLPKGLFTDRGIQETNAWGGGRQLGILGAASEIHFTNGKVDPWSRLSILHVDPLTQEKQHVSAFVIEGGSHCMDFYEPAASDSTLLREGREAIKEAVKGFIERHYAAISSGTIPNVETVTNDSKSYASGTTIYSFSTSEL
ncbi:serine carboxypeptidase [Cyclospora cayetanensis]|uniref:Serine carboxypeptidase n=1 Tax=Cyclospora cayetanensis TaxID=88456 RepID=A0A1D3CSS1_9EIME|nr:serine carboxypeptidase [Cyclospora cayetanensis]